MNETLELIHRARAKAVEIYKVSEVEDGTRSIRPEDHFKGGKLIEFKQKDGLIVSALNEVLAAADQTRSCVDLRKGNIALGTNTIFYRIFLDWEDHHNPEKMIDLVYQPRKFRQNECLYIPDVMVLASDERLPDKPKLPYVVEAKDALDQIMSLRFIANSFSHHRVQAMPIYPENVKTLLNVALCDPRIKPL